MEEEIATETTEAPLPAAETVAEMPSENDEDSSVIKRF